MICFGFEYVFDKYVVKVVESCVLFCDCCVLFY